MAGYKITDDAYREMLSGKTVAIVGPAPCVKDIEQGSHIESFDFVVRVNAHAIVPKNESRWLGERTDILYNCLNNRRGDGGVLDFWKWHRERIQLICSTIPVEELKSVQISINKLQAKTNPLNFKLIDPKFFMTLRQNVRSRPHTGTVAICDLLRKSLRVKSLYITGFTFFQSGLPSYLRTYKDIPEERAQREAHRCSHKADNEFAFFRDVVWPGHQKRIQLDPTLERLVRSDASTDQ